MSRNLLSALLTDFSSMTFKFIAALHLEDSNTSQICCGGRGVVSQHRNSLNRKIYDKLDKSIGNFHIRSVLQSGYFWYALLIAELYVDASIICYIKVNYAYYKFSRIWVGSKEKWWNCFGIICRNRILGGPQFLSVRVRFCSDKKRERKAEWFLKINWTFLCSRKRQTDKETDSNSSWG